jgi:ElaA protein
LVKKEHRGKDLGKKIMKKSIDQIKKDPLEKKIELSAQKYLLKFYLDLGFKKIGEEYLEDNIPHVKMILKI